MSGVTPEFWKTPFRYLRWAAIQKPAKFYSIAIGAMGPVTLVIAPPIRRYFNDGPIAKIPQTYPIPKGPRPRPTGFED
ncbi:hypothetical protein M011DRAFT_476841 [Sporormia fimetaria CBS 119925]|uniref:NADH-ubiquinone oxidoreductase 9.5 kDa subunit n=1 Tax=Sporormia fimetaria CBS 119925 TaxID=1340428 RepID=A0A6A6VDH5_9PLEO|nr:hypothetical protein M011DRAFT_476841 [Sporormia fimetaria CBS 119925]